MQGVATKRTIGRVFFWPVAVITVVGAGLLYGSFRADEHVADAQMVNFYSGECTGGWDGTSFASGEPQVTAESSETYTKTNSAYLENKISPITCDQYSGSLPPETYHTRVMVRFSWKQETPKVLPLPAAIDGEVVSTSTGTTTENVGIGDVIQIAETGTSSTATASSTLGDGASTTPAVLNDTSTSTETLPADEATSSTPTPPATASTTEAVSPVSEPETSIEPKTDPSPAPVVDPKPAPEPAPDVVSWWPLLLPAYAHAEERATSTSETLPLIDTVLSEPVMLSTEMATDTTTETPVITAVTSSRFGTTTVSDGTQFVVQYTLDGVSWQVLGYVTTVDADVRLEFPKEVLPTLDDISHMKISITPLIQIDTMQPVYLDAMWLEVSYAPLGELGVHSISDIVPTITPFDSVISDTAVTGSTEVSSTSLPHFTPREFAESIIQVHGIDKRYVLTTLRVGTSTHEVWLFDMRSHLVHRIGRDKAQIGTMQAGTKDGMIFWLDAERDAIYTYDLRTAGSLHEMTLVGNLPVGGEYVLTFPFTSWQVMWRGDSFYFKTRKTGEVFQDENTDSARDFFTYFTLPTFLPFDHIQTIGGTFVTEGEVTEAATSTSTATSSESTSAILETNSSSSTIEVSSTSTVERAL